MGTIEDYALMINHVDQCDKILNQIQYKKPLIILGLNIKFNSRQLYSSDFRSRKCAKRLRIWNWMKPEKHSEELSS